MGLDHGVYCVGCCWLLFVLLVAVGLASLPWMGLITLIVCAEKLLPGRKAITASVAVLLVGSGLLTLARPELLTLMSG
jgi:predicted metal-binding membrane protein